MIEAPLGLAFAAGLVATFNPCGFAMLPAYLSYFLGLNDDAEAAGTRTAVTRALVVGGIVSLGFLAVFGTAGVLLTAGLRSLVSVIPWLALTVGIGIVVLGIAMWRGYTPVVHLPKPGATGRERGRGNRSLFAFGVSYAIASLSCTLPVFLTVVVSSVTGANFASGVLTFVVYGLGMSLVLLVLTIAVALARTGLVTRLRASSRHVQRASAVLLVLAGLYITWFWAFTLSTDAGSQNFTTRWVEQVSQRLTQTIGERPVLVGLVLGGVVLLAIVLAVVRRGGRASEEVDHDRTSIEGTRKAAQSGGADGVRSRKETSAGGEEQSVPSEGAVPLREHV